MANEDGINMKKKKKIKWHTWNSGIFMEIKNYDLGNVI